ncbi:histidine kinase-like ATPase, partial [Coniochaeta sp. 2T2.1]
MPISALPQETVRLLGSPLVYSSPVSVVKELVDNALDARATSVEVLISADTVDSVEVRDNGHGIHPVDFNTLGHRGCTSKLRTFEDIQTVGGVTLGFRGDALASATTVGTLSIVTRTAGEPTASRLLFSEKGGVGKIERVSGPVGTAVKVTQIF